MTKQDIINYHKKWSNGKTGIAWKFVDMLSQKAYFTALRKTEVYAYDGLKGEKELTQMLIIADDLVAEGVIR